MILEKASLAQAQLFHSFSFSSFLLKGKRGIKLLMFNYMLRTGVLFASFLMPKILMCKKDFRR